MQYVTMHYRKVRCDVPQQSAPLFGGERESEISKISKNSDDQEKQRWHTHHRHQQTCEKENNDTKDNA